VVRRPEIAEHVWDERYDPFSNVIDVYVQRLRRKVDPPGQESCIRTAARSSSRYRPRKTM
jgi:DNA-binding response OmpR family regulator